MEPREIWSLECWQQPEAEEATSFSFRGFRGSEAQLTPWFLPSEADFGLLDSKTVRG